MTDAPFAREAVTAVQDRLQQLHESLPDDQRPVLEALLAHAAADGGDERSQRVGEQNSIIIVGGRIGSPIRIGLDPGSVSLNPQPIPPGRLSGPR